MTGGVPSHVTRFAARLDSAFVVAVSLFVVDRLFIAQEEEGEEEEEEEETSGRRQASFRVLDLSAAAYDSPFRGDSKSEEPTAQFSIDYRFCFVQSIGH